MFHTAADTVALYEPAPLPPGAAYADAPARHGGAFVFPGRRLVLLTDRGWPHAPESCPFGGPGSTEWLFDGEVLVCRGCGLDST